MTTIAIWKFHTASVAPGLGFLTLVRDTISFVGSTTKQVVDDRTVSTDTIFRYFKVKLGDTITGAPFGMTRIDLTSCGGSTISEIRLAQDRKEDLFAVTRPTVPITIGTADSTLVNYTYAPLTVDPHIRTATATFISSTG